MMDEHSIKQAAMDEVKQMLRDHLAKHLGKLGTADEGHVEVDKPAHGMDDLKKAVETPGDEPVEKPDHPEDGDEALLGKDDEDKAEGEEHGTPDAEDKAEGDEPKGEKHSLIALAMKKLNQHIRPKGE